MLAHALLRIAAASTLLLTTAAGPLPHDAESDLAARILADTRLDRVETMARALIRTGFTAGDGYPNVWIRDLATFMPVALDEHPAAEIRRILLAFVETQGPAYDVQDRIGSDDGSGWKNTVETDQEASLVQAVRMYVERTGDDAFLRQTVGREAVIDRLRLALEWLYRERFSAAHGLVWGATTADWGDVQPEDVPGIKLNEKSHRAIDVYDNGMVAQAIRDLLVLLRRTGADGAVVAAWEARLAALRVNARRHLWDGAKFRPHVYLDGSPFPASFDEDAIYYHGGTAVGIEAGFLTPAEAKASFARMVANKRAAGATTVGLTLWPAYPAGLFANPILSEPYTYQNGGDWSWFGARIVSQMIAYGEPGLAYQELAPMLDRVLANGAFHEWYALDGSPRGSGQYRGEAGVLAKAIGDLRAWARRTPPKVLVFTKTNGFRHGNIALGVATLSQLGRGHGFTVEATEDASAFTAARLAGYAAVVFFNTTGDVLTDQQQEAFKAYVEGGGGFAGIHSASDTEHGWPWFTDTLVGASFVTHGAVEPARVTVEDAAHPSTAMLPNPWEATDEWYSFTRNVRGLFHVLLSLGDDHPIAWCKDVGAGRSWYTGLGHTNEAFADARFKAHVANGIAWAAGAAQSTSGCTVTLR